MTMHTPALTHHRAVTHTLTTACINRCGFCPLPLATARQNPSMKRWRQWLRRAQVWEPTALHVTGGEPITKDRHLAETVRYYGYPDIISYLADLLAAAQEESRGALLPSLEIGELRRADLQRLRPHIANFTVGIVTFDPTLFGKALLWNSPTVVPPRRLDLIEMLGALRIPTTINLLVGLGECESARVQTLAAMAEMQAKHGHLQHLRVTPFRPQPGTLLETDPSADADLVVRTVRQAAEILGSVAIQIPALEMGDCLERCIEAGAQDLGPIAADPDTDMTASLRAWGDVERRLQQRGYRMLEVLPLTEQAVARGLYPDSLRGCMSHQIERLARRHTLEIGAPPIAAPATSLEA